MEKIKQHWKVGLGIVFIIVLGIGQMFKNTEDPMILPLEPTQQEQETLVYIYVDIKGEVQYPGVYKVLSETRLFQVIRLAGGLKESADALAVNLSMKLYDQTVIYIPHIDEDFPSVHEGEGTDHMVININQASLEELMSLPGVGEVTANAIIQYRNEHGGFSSIEDLVKVPGIGEATFERLKERISIS